jgi:hypothetical protein
MKEGPGVLFLNGTAGTNIGFSGGGFIRIENGVLAVDNDLAMGEATNTIELKPSAGVSDPSLGFRAVASGFNGASFCAL